MRHFIDQLICHENNWQAIYNVKSLVRVLTQIAQLMLPKLKETMGISACWSTL